MLLTSSVMREARFLQDSGSESLHSRKNMEVKMPSVEAAHASRMMAPTHGMHSSGLKVVPILSLAQGELLCVCQGRLTTFHGYDLINRQPVHDSLQ